MNDKNIDIVQNLLATVLTSLNTTGSCVVRLSMLLIERVSCIVDESNMINLRLTNVHTPRVIKPHEVCVL